MRGSSMSALDILRRLAEEKAAGPIPSFTPLHLTKAIEVIGRERIGRLGLSERLALGEGATRTLIDRLLEAGYIRISKRGCELTSKGSSVLRYLSSKLGPMGAIPTSPMTVGPHDFGILVKKAADKVSSGIEQRDAAVRTGANGAVTLVCAHGQLRMPHADYLRGKESQDIVKVILDKFQPNENDVIIIAGADTERIAEDSARAAAWTLMK
jgi:hypothetical protein